MFLSRQPKERIIQRVGQQLRINRSKIKDASDTNTDFDDIDGAIRSGYFLKEGLANNEDFYYLNLLITVTAPSVEDLEWKASEIKKAPAFAGYGCLQLPFSGGAGILFCPPLVSMEKGLFERGKRNLLTGARPAAIRSLHLRCATTTESFWGSTNITVPSSSWIFSTLRFTRTPIWRSWVPAAQARPLRCSSWR